MTPTQQQILSRIEAGTHVLVQNWQPISTVPEGELIIVGYSDGSSKRAFWYDETLDDWLRSLSKKPFHVDEPLMLPIVWMPDLEIPDSMVQKAQEDERVSLELTPLASQAAQETENTLARLTYYQREALRCLSDSTKVVVEPNCPMSMKTALHDLWRFGFVSRTFPPLSYAITDHGIQAAQENKE